MNLCRMDILRLSTVWNPVARAGIDDNGGRISNSRKRHPCDRLSHRLVEADTARFKSITIIGSSFRPRGHPRMGQWIPRHAVGPQPMSYARLPLVRRRGELAWSALGETW